MLRHCSDVFQKQEKHSQLRQHSEHRHYCITIIIFPSLTLCLSQPSTPPYRVAVVSSPDGFPPRLPHSFCSLESMGRLVSFARCRAGEYPLRPCVFVQRWADRLFGPLVHWSAAQRTTEMLADQLTGKNSGPAPADYQNWASARPLLNYLREVILSLKEPLTWEGMVETSCKFRCLSV
jgi:hypothetical protein